MHWVCRILCIWAISEVNMQLIVRGEQTHVLDVAPSANVEALRAQLSLLEVPPMPL